jgi:hypothetical protein
MLQAFGTYLKWAILWEWRANAARGHMPKLPEFDEDESIWAWEDAAATQDAGNER